MPELDLTQSALLLIDIQQDFLERPGLLPSKDELLTHLQPLLRGWRANKLPIFHIRTRIQPDGSNRMPHWVQQDTWACIAGTRGYEPPPALVALANETVLHKRFFSAFDCPELLPTLQQAGINTLVVAGLYTHGCIRATVLDAYQYGFNVIVAEEAISSTEPLHAELSRAWLDGRAAQFLSTQHLLTPSTTASILPTAATLACIHAAKAGRHWAQTPAVLRAALLERWADRLEQDTTALTTLLATEIGKPIAEAQDELRRTLSHIRIAARLAREALESESIPHLTVRWQPLGTVALITPWNNPLAIAAGKLAPALAFGNSCVWKPSPYAPQCSAWLYQTLLESGLPNGVVEPVTGGAAVSRNIVTNHHIDVVSITGSHTTGQTIAALCSLHSKPLQAELGGNNAVVILDDWQWHETDLAALAQSVFGFAGQRCTAIRRIIVQKGIFEHFTTAFAATVKRLRIGDPLDPATQVGPLMSVQHREQVQARLEAAIHAGAAILAQATLPAAADRDNGRWAGHWSAPTLLTHVDPTSLIACEETFGPVAVIMQADDLDHALAIANAVPQGLLAALYSHDPAAQTHFQKHIETGMLKLSSGLMALSAEAPFCGWKNSAIGPPEHGIWDRDFYTKAQTIYP